MTAFLSSDDEVQIGAVFTPLEVGAFAVRTFGVVDRWLEGSTVFDPTMGQGHLLEALVDEAINRGVRLEDIPFERLFGNELSSAYRNQALEKFAAKYDVDMGAQFTHGDVLTLKARRYDIILGNPPWVSYVDLPEEYRSSIKPLFAKYGLVDEQRDLLLGKSRIDLAALIVQRVVVDFLVDGGEAILFLPLSLLLNDGAHACFRRFRVHDVSFAVLSVYDYNTCQAFPGINTRYGLVRIRRGQPTTYPVPFMRMENGKWKDFLASPLFADDDPWSISRPEQIQTRFELPQIVLKKESQPRQGVNTGGANDVFFFDHVTPVDAGLAEVLTSDGSMVLLPQRFLFPLVTANVFRARGQEPSKWVLLPYNTDGRILSSIELGMERELDSYFQSKRQRLQQRKGVMLNATIKRGLWWTMLGVGPYSFYPYKVIWESYGRSSFRPMIIPGHWQANQSLQAFIPLRTREEAEQVLERLEHHSIEDYLRSLQMEGTMNWAQPGKIKKLITAIS